MLPGKRRRRSSRSRRPTKSTATAGEVSLEVIATREVFVRGRRQGRAKSLCQITRFAMRDVIIVQVARRLRPVRSPRRTCPPLKEPLEFHSRLQYRSCVPPVESRMSLSRRAFLSATAPLPFLGLPHAFASERRRPRVAAVYTVFFRRSHAFNILENFFLPYL